MSESKPEERKWKKAFASPVICDGCNGLTHNDSRTKDWMIMCDSCLVEILEAELQAANAKIAELCGIDNYLLAVDLDKANAEIARLTNGIKEICNTCEMIKGERAISDRKDAEIAERDRVIEKFIKADTEESGCQCQVCCESRREWVKKELGKREAPEHTKTL